MTPSETALALWQQLASNYGPQHLLTLREDIEAHVKRIEVAARQNELLPLDVAEELAERLLGLLASLGSLSEEQQGWVIGAARYFISLDDEVPDTQGVLGLEDDAAIFNHVAALLGRSDLKVET